MLISNGLVTLSALRNPRTPGKSLTLPKLWLFYSLKGYENIKALPGGDKPLWDQ